jgi:predicted DNA-binding transcriptional regulator YafY
MAADITGKESMPKNHDALFRQWHMLRLVPRYPQKITVQDIRHSLEGEGFEITERSIQRDLNDLSNSFPLSCDNREKPYGWSWQKDAVGFDLPGLTVPEALTLVMVEQHLHDVLPAPMVDQLQPHFKSARKRLDAEPKPGRGRSWLDKVRVVPPTQPLLPPRIDANVQHAVSEALLHEKQLNVRYRRRGDKTAVEYHIHPLALIQRGPTLYIYCRIYDYEDARSLALHRMEAAQILEDSAEYPKGFLIDRQVDLGTWGFGPGELINVELVFQPGYGDHLYETSLSKDQVIEPLADGQLRITATVADTPQLCWWLLGFGEGVEVMAPQSMRDWMAKTARKLASLYR